MTILLVVIAALSLAGVLLGIVSLKRSGDGGKASVQLENELRDLSVRLDESRKSTESAISSLRQEMSQGLQNSREELSRSMASVSSTNTEQLGKINDSIVTSFKAINDTNTSQNAMMREQFTVSVGEMRESNEKKLDELRVSNEKRLDEMRVVVDEKLSDTVTKRINASFEQVITQLTEVNKALGEVKTISTSVTEDLGSFNKILSGVKTRGVWAEYQLRDILDQILPTMYVTNFAPRKNSRDVVEFAVKIPSGDDLKDTIYLPIDSKFPMEDYARLCDALDSGSADEIKTARSAIAQRVRAEARDISEKYINEPVTTPYAILYLATEGLYAEVMSAQGGLSDEIRRKYSVLIAGPTTITALLNTLSIGFRTVQVTKNIGAVTQLLAAVKQQYGVFAESLEKVSKNLATAQNSVDAAKKRNDIINKKLRDIGDIDEAEANKLLEPASQDPDNE